MAHDGPRKEGCERSGSSLGSGSNINEDCLALRSNPRSNVAYYTLGLCVDPCPLREGRLRALLTVKHDGSSVDAAQPSFIFEMDQIAPNCFLRNPQSTCKFECCDSCLRLKCTLNVVVSCDAVH